MYIYLIRHGETAWNLQGKIQGDLDIPLNDKGKLQAEQMAEKLQNKNITYIYTSDLSRSYQTAQIIQQSLNTHDSVLKIYPESRLRERNFGLWQGLTWNQVKTEHHSQYLQLKHHPLSSAPPQGENLIDVSDRVDSFLNDLPTDLPSNIAIISHNTPLRLILAKAQSINLKDINKINHLHNTELITLKTTQKGIQVVDSIHSLTKEVSPSLPFRNEIL